MTRVIRGDGVENGSRVRPGMTGWAHQVKASLFVLGYGFVGNSGSCLSHVTVVNLRRSPNQYVRLIPLIYHKDDGAGGQHGPRGTAGKGNADET